MFLKRFFTYSYFVVLSAILNSCSSYNEPTLQEQLDLLDDNYKQRIIAHRGVWRPNISNQNSVAAIARAGEIKIWGAEIDVRQTHDGELLLNHDEEIGSISIAYSTTEQIQSYCRKNGILINTLEEALSVLAQYPTMNIMIEIKDCYPDFLFSIIKSYNLMNRITYISFDENICHNLSEMGCHPIYLVLNEITDDIFSRIEECGVDGISVYHMSILNNLGYINDIKNRKITLTTWGSSSLEETKFLLDKGVDFVTVDL